MQRNWRCSRRRRHYEGGSEETAVDDFFVEGSSINSEIYSKKLKCFSMALDSFCPLWGNRIEPCFFCLHWLVSLDAMNVVKARSRLERTLNL